MILVVRSDETWWLAGPVAVLPLLCREIWVWSLSTLGPCSGDAVAVGHSGELEGVSQGQWVKVGPLSPLGLGSPWELGALGAHTHSGQPCGAVDAGLWGCRAAAGSA